MRLFFMLQPTKYGTNWNFHAIFENHKRRESVFILSFFPEQIEILLTFRFSGQKTSSMDMLKLQIKPVFGKFQYFMTIVVA